jgi:hypothetical protein
MPIYNLLEWGVEPNSAWNREKLLAQLQREVSEQGSVAVFSKISPLDFMSASKLFDLAWLSIQLSKVNGCKTYYLVAEGQNLDFIKNLGIDRLLEFRKSIKCILKEVSSRDQSLTTVIDFEDLRNRFSGFFLEQFGSAPIFLHPKWNKSFAFLQKEPMGIELFWSDHQLQYYFCISASHENMKKLSTFCREAQAVTVEVSDYWFELGERMIRRLVGTSSFDPEGNPTLNFQMVKMFQGAGPVRLQFKHWTGETFEMTLNGIKLHVAILVQPLSHLKAIKSAA